jgi:hypothetical protein
MFFSVCSTAKSLDRHFGATLNVGNCLLETKLCLQMESPKLCQDEELESLESVESELSSETMCSHCVQHSKILIWTLTNRPLMSIVLHSSKDLILMTYFDGLPPGIRR